MCSHTKPFLPPVDVQHTQYPCLFFLLERNIIKPCGHKTTTQRYIVMQKAEQKVQRQKNERKKKWTDGKQKVPRPPRKRCDRQNKTIQKHEQNTIKSDREGAEPKAQQRTFDAAAADCGRSTLGMFSTYPVWYVATPSAISCLLLPTAVSLRPPPPPSPCPLVPPATHLRLTRFSFASS